MFIQCICLLPNQLNTTTPCTCQILILHNRFRKYLYYKVSHVILRATVLIFFISLLLRSFFIEKVTIHRRALIVQNICLIPHSRLTIREQMSITEQTHPDQTTQSLKKLDPIVFRTSKTGIRIPLIDCQRLN